MSRVAAISVDLDGLEHYLAIHGLPGDAGGDDAVHRLAVPRFLDLFAEHGIAATFFAIGRDLETAPAVAEVLRRARAAGHEIGNHSDAHRYDLVRLDDTTLRAEVVRGEEVIRAAVGEGCVGFRAPGYNVDERVLATCRELGYRYDSSVFPAVPYYLAKAAVMAGLRVAGRRSRATLGHPKVLACPTTPYQPDPADYRRRGGGGLVELPITVVPGLRFPFIGTWVCLWPEGVFDAAYGLVRRRGFLNLELHGIELLDLVGDGLPSALQRQPDLRVPLARKRARLARALARIRTDYEVVPLREVPAALGLGG